MAPAGPEPGINKVVAGARRAGNGIGALRLVRWGARPRNRRTHRAAGTGGRLQQLTCTLDMAPVADKFSCPRPPRCVCRMTRRLFRPSTTISAAATNARRSSTHRAVFPTTSERRFLMGPITVEPVPVGESNRQPGQQHAVVRGGCGAGSVSLYRKRYGWSTSNLQLSGWNRGITLARST
jgi:hypothetical protein